MATCHQVADDGATEGAVALVGNPNVGKSVLFQRLTARYAVVANYPGTTLEITRAGAQFDPDTIVVDTPGIVTFPPRTEDGEVVSRLLLDGRARALVQVGDAKSIRRTLLLTSQLAELDVPMVLALNMADEARERGVHVEQGVLAERLGVPVVATVATRGDGVTDLVAAIPEARRCASRPAYPAAVESALAELEGTLPESAIPPRALGLLWLAGDAAAEAEVASLGTSLRKRLSETRERAEAVLGESAATAIQRARLEHAETIAAEVTAEPPPATAPGIAERIALLSTHRLWGLPVLAAVLYAIYWFVGVLGAGVLVGLLEDGLFGTVVNPRLTDAVRAALPLDLAADALVGPYGLWTMGMTYALALILPIVTTFFLAFSVLEDSGYLPRLAVVSNRLFTALGLNGKAALPMVLGLGCVTMATLTTRILDSRRDRVLATLLLALGIPCSAQLGVVLGMLGSISLLATLVWAGVVAAVVLAVGALAARVVPGERSQLLVELPPLRLPRASNVAVKTVARLEWYLKEVVPLFLAGAAVLFMLDATGALPVLVDAGEPVVTGWLGLPPAATAALLIGFVRRDFGATGLFVMYGQGSLTAEQALVAMITITLFIPCVASALVIVRERGLRVALAMAATIFPLAFLVGGVMHRVLLAAGMGA